MSYKNHTKDLYRKVDYEQIPRRIKESDKPFSYIPMSNIILRCDKAIIKETGEEVDITSDFKITYTYMRERYMYNTCMGKPYYEGWDSIAVILGKNVSVFKHKNDRDLPVNKLMEKLGLLIILDKKTCRSSHKMIKDISEVLDKVVFLNSKDADFQKRKSEERQSYLNGNIEGKTKAATPEVHKYEIPPVEIYEDLPLGSLNEDIGGNEYWESLDDLDEFPF